MIIEQKMMETCVVAGEKHKPNQFMRKKYAPITNMNEIRSYFSFF